MIEKINDHVIQAHKRLLRQYRNNPELNSILASFNEQVQQLENAIFSLNGRMDRDVISSAILDAYGQIVGQERLGLSDEIFRLVILVKIGKNTSQGDPERVIQIYKMLTRSERVFYQEYYPAAIGIYSSGEINPLTAQFIYENLDDILPAGVRLDHFGQFAPTGAFAFDGDPETTEGFSSVANPEVGGMFAKLHIY